MNTNSSMVTPKKKKFFLSRNSGAVGAAQKRPSSVGSSSSTGSSPRTPDSPVQRKAKRTYAFREKDSFYDSGLDDSISEADMATPPRFLKSWKVGTKVKQAATPENKFYRLRNGFSTSTPLKMKNPSQPQSKNIWQAALEENPELKAFVEKFNAELKEVSETKLELVDHKGNRVEESDLK